MSADTSFRTNNGGEFKFEKFLKSDGICPKHAIPRHPKQKWCGRKIKSNFGRNYSFNIDQFKAPPQFTTAFLNGEPEEEHQPKGLSLTRRRINLIASYPV